VTLDMHATGCHATAAAGYCTVEFDVWAKMPDGSTIVQPSRNTIVLRKRIAWVDVPPRVN
jgi:hypothetical protein